MEQEYINQAIYNSYAFMAGESTIDEILRYTPKNHTIPNIDSGYESTEDEHQRSWLPLFFINPGADYVNEEIDVMIDLFEKNEEYEKCSVLTKLKK